MDETGLAVLVVASLVAGAGAIAYAVHRDRKRQAAWRRVAQRRRGEIVDYRASFFQRSRGIDVVVGKARVFVDMFTVSTGKSSVTYTRGRARYPVEGGPVFRVYKEGVFSSLGKALGTQDLELGGNAAFDADFMVKGDDIEVIRLAWTDRAKQLMLGPLRDCRVASDGEEIVITGVGAWVDEHKIESLIDLTGELAQVDFYGRAVLEALADEGARVSAAGGPWDGRRAESATLVLRGRQVTVTPDQGHRGAVLELRAPNDADLPPLEAALGRDDPPPPLASTELIPLLGRLSGQRLVCTAQSLVLRLPALATSAAQVRAGAELLAALGSPPPGGAFR